MLHSIFKIASQLYYGWRMVALVSAIRVLGGGLHNYGFTVFFLPISADLGLNRAETSLAFSLARAQGAIEGPFVGYIIDRFGPRPMILMATLLSGLGYIALGWVHSYTTFLIVFLGIISLSFTPGFVHAPMAVGNTWFVRWRARAMTIISSAVPIGGTLITPFLAMAVEAWGWRWGAILAGTLFLLIGIPLGLGVRSSPESMGLLPDGDAPMATPLDDPTQSAESTTTAIRNDPTLRDVMKTGIFWLFVIAMTVRVAAYSTISVHFVPIMVWKVLSQEGAAFLLAAFAFLNWAAHYVIGWFADSMNRPKLLTICTMTAAVSMLVLIWSSGDWPLWAFTIGFAAIDASFPIVWATIGDFFGRKFFATIRGTMSFFYTWGSVLGPVIAGAAYDRSQSYLATLWGLVAILTLGALLTALTIKPWSALQTARKSV
ncbi:MAG TPA: MFS transporter [Candidatus Binatus sp.]|nr:MFS transporter [Candidatus Binatus sp.]